MQNMKTSQKQTPLAELLVCLWDVFMLTGGASYVTSDLDEGEGGARGEGFVLVLHLVAQVLLDAPLLKHHLLALGAEQHAGGHRHRHRILRLGLGGGADGVEVSMNRTQEIIKGYMYICYVPQCLSKRTHKRGRE